MNTVTLDSMAFDYFETAGEDYLTGIEGEGILGAVAYGLCQGAVGGISGFGAGLGASIALAQVSPPMAAEAAPWLIGVGTIAGAVGGLVQGSAEGWKNGW
ncbi:hypothetical protein AB6P00_00270 [Streptococcus mutans]|uniref:hypothetical protein n=4 Tax=Streptococcus mutans TaxID=1309 RepID=UPI0007AF2BD5|nr:hypothetical protein [Streptococcus mutans]KZM63219.1 hypothetical protein AWN62_04705 [Streptococcus mutans]MCB5015715.1 hypothetical protein [Streptococcus mutans]MCB5151595.1 hypothetical protein [Streptococcus mutans]MDT9562094.1 hypothetical protein [Streptococcus mutans]MDT9565788.1 hypothetical protein [Streptococcus mutans]